MNNHETWTKCKSCGYFYDIRVDIICPICLKYEFDKRRNQTIQRIPKHHVGQKNRNVL